MTKAIEAQGIGIPLPTPGRWSEPFWERARHGELVYQRCQTCGVIPSLPIRTCTCGGQLVWERASGRATLYSWTVVWRPPHPAFTVPYVPAIAHLEEGAWLMTSLIGCAPEAAEADMALQVEFHPAGGDIWLPYVRPIVETPDA